MNLTNRTKTSLAQLFDLIEYQYINIIFGKYSFPATCDNIEDSQNNLFESKGDIVSLLNEVISTQKTLKNKVPSKTSFNQQWDDLVKCLLLDGYRIEGNNIIPIEPDVDGVIAIEDDLTTEIRNSSLSKRNDIIRIINESAEGFKNATPDYNSCLSKARIALETIIRNKVEDESGTNEGWGKSLNILKANGFITNDEEQAIASTYKFVSDGSHIPIEFTREEYARYGRNLIMTVCYFIIKKQNVSNRTSGLI